MKILIKNFLEDVYRELDELFNINEWKKKYIVLFGKSISTERIVEYFEERNILVQGFVDNSIEKQGAEYRGCKVYSVEELLGTYKENAFVIIASSAYSKMKKQLKEMGYHDEQIYQIRNFDLKNKEAFPFEEKYDYQEMSLRDIQLEAFNILKFIREFCDSKGIRYYLAYGSLLGAIRHRGFIPWDDDIDICMPWNDYIRFCSEFIGGDDYELFSIFRDNINQPKCYSLITKVMSKNTIMEEVYFLLHCRSSICVDVFPMSGYPDDENERKLYDKELKELYSFWSRNVIKNIKDNNIEEKIYNDSVCVIKEAMTRYDYNKSKYIGTVECIPYNHKIALKEKYELPSKVLFEGEYFDAPNDADYILALCYGNYMEFPPKEERRPIHFLNTYRIKEKR